MTPRVLLLIISGILNIALLYLAAYLMDTNARLRIRIEFLERNK